MREGGYTGGMAALWRTIPLDRGDSGRRVDLVLLRHLRAERGVSRNRIQGWIEAGDVTINGSRTSRAACRVHEGDDVRVRLTPAPPRARPAAEAIPLDILYEDDHLLAINKPAGMVSHPSFKHAAGTLMNGVFGLARTWPAGTKPGLLGRLDKQTSGVVLVTKRPAAHAALQRAMDARRVDKDYLAVVWGRPSPARGTIDLALDRDPWDRRRVTVTDRKGQPAVTRYERLAVSVASSLPVASLVRCRLVTGRMHQIRVHLAARGWPVVGDQVYGRRGAAAPSGPGSAPPAFPRQALHAWRVAFDHPLTGARLAIEAPLPADMRALCDDMGLGIPGPGRVKRRGD